MGLSVVILAAGKGTRMRSNLPKVLHKVAHKSMVQHVIDTAAQLDAEQTVVVYGHGGDALRGALADQKLEFAEQAEQLGTGHAVAQAMPEIEDGQKVLVLYGDVPLTSVETLQALVEVQPAAGIGLLTVTLPNPTGYGRIIRHQGEVVGIVEQKDANDEQLAIQEVNTGILIADAAQLRHWLNNLGNDNAQGEYYLTDVIAMAHADGAPIATTQPQTAIEVEGANNRLQMAALERAWQRREADKLMSAGVALRDPARFDLRGELHCGSDVEIDINVIVEGKVTIEDGALIGAGCILKNCHIGAGSVIKPNSIVEDAKVGAGCTVGPMARLRPGAELADDAHIGNFVEMKKAYLGEGSKANHLTYLGDATIGRGVNIGAGTITCNYDGANKHQTIIEDDVFVGSDTQLVAPVKVGQGATIAAGTTVTKDVDAGELVLSRVKQKSLSGWQRPLKKK